MANFAVSRDRPLLTAVLDKIGERFSSYRDIGAKVDTEVIIEIVKFKIGDNMPALFYYEDLITSVKSAKDKSKACGAALEGRLILVSGNEVVGIFTLREVLSDPKRVLNEKLQKYEFVLRDSDSEHLNEKISEKLITLLKGSNVENSIYKETVNLTY